MPHIERGSILFVGTAIENPSFELDSALLEIAADLAENGTLTDAMRQQMLADRTRRFDKRGEPFYDQSSALHNPFAVPIPMPPYIGSYACSTAAATAIVLRGASRAWRPRISVWPIRARNR